MFSFIYDLSHLRFAKLIDPLFKSSEHEKRRTDFFEIISQHDVCYHLGLNVAQLVTCSEFRHSAHERNANRDDSVITRTTCEKFLKCGRAELRHVHPV